MHPAPLYKFVNAFGTTMSVSQRPSGRSEITAGTGRFLLEKDDAPALAASVLIPQLPQPKKPLFGGDETVVVSSGNDKTEARVYVPTSDGGAERNLNFAKANLAAYLTWVEREPARKEAQRVKDKADAERRRQIEMDLEELKSSVRSYANQVTLKARALEAYNAFRNTNVRTWEGVFAPFNVDKATIDRWIRVVEDIDKTATSK